MRKKISIKRIQSLSEIKENDGYTILTSYSLEEISPSIKDSIKDLVNKEFISSYEDITCVYFLETEYKLKNTSGFYNHKNAVIFAFSENARVNLPRWHNTICKFLDGFTGLFKLKRKND